MKPQTLTPKDFKDILQEEFAKRCRRNPKYSIRSYANFLEMDFSTLAKILNGNRTLGKRSVERLGSRLGIAPTRLLRYTSKTSSSAKADSYKQMGDEYKITSEWYHSAILELIRLPDFQQSERWISTTLNISLPDARLAVSRLMNSGMILTDKNGTWMDNTSGKTTSITPLASTQSQRKLQAQILDKAIAALEQIPVSQRDQTSMTMAIDRNLLPEARTLIKSFRRDLAKLLSRNGNLNDVFHLSIGLYPVTNLSTKEKA